MYETLSQFLVLFSRPFKSLPNVYVRKSSIVFIQLNEHAWPMNVTLHKYFIDDRMTILAKSKNVIFLCFYVFCGLAHFYSGFKTILSIWLTGFHLIRCSLSQNMMTRLDFDTLLLSLNHLIIIICEKKVFVDFPQMYRSMINIFRIMQLTKIISC